MERAAELLADRGADGARGRAPRRLPPAGAVREGVPPPPRRRAVGLPRRPLGAARRRRRDSRAPPPRQPVRTAARRPVGPCAPGPSIARPSRGAHRMPRQHGGGEHGATPRSAGARSADARCRARRPAIGIALGLLIDWFPVQASTQAETIDTLWDVLIIASVPIFVLVTTIVLYGDLAFRDAARARRTSTARRSTATRGSRSSGPRSRRSCSSALVHLRLRRPARHREGAGRRRRSSSSRRRRAVRLDLRLPARAARRSSRPPALPARGRAP